MNYADRELLGTVDIAALIRQFLNQVGTGDLKTKGLYPDRIGDFELSVSFGMGVSSGIPWIAIVGAGQKVSNGIYPVFLYYKAYDHLVLAYGISETESPSLSWGSVVQDKAQISARMKELGFVAKRYGNSYLAKDYPRVSQLVSQASFALEVKADIVDLLREYRQVLNDHHVREEPALSYASPKAVSKITDISPIEIPLNQILFGPPGTGKTYSTINHALAILAPELLTHRIVDDNDRRKQLKDRFHELVKEERVRFTTFHQSFSYEDFVEGLRADSDSESGQIEYRVESGVFKQLCDDARTHDAQGQSGIRDNPRIWKISINGTGQSATKTYCLDHGEARIGWGQTGDLRQSIEQNTYYDALGSGDKGTLSYFSEQVAVGDILLCIHSADLIGSIGVVTGDYRYDEQAPPGILPNYQHLRPVRWLYRDINLSILPLNDSRQFTLKTVYAISRFSWADLLAYLQQQGVQPVDPVIAPATERKPYVLIIDEINRGNVSRIFGELITLIESSKREGAEEALSVKLPYSKKPFSVPGNVYLLGTMNTADRSLAGLDIALRRRFSFCEMPPRPDLLEGVMVEQTIDIALLLSVMNKRIEVLLDREHCLGHAYFMALRKSCTLEQLALIFRTQVLPLLQEYFFEDWQRIQWVLNDHRKEDVDRFIFQQSSDVQALFGADVDVGLNGQTWHINEDAFDRLEAYLGVIDHQQSSQTVATKGEAKHGELVLRELTTGTIEIWRAGVRQIPSKPLLRSVADDVGVSQFNAMGNPLNTRALGRQVITRLLESA